MYAISFAERAVLAELCADGPTDEQIAERLELGPETIRTHIKRLLVATGMPHRTALVAAILRGRIKVRAVGSPRRHNRQHHTETAA